MISDIGILKNGYAFQSNSYTPDGNYNILTISNVTGERYVNTPSCNKIATFPIDLQCHQSLDVDDILISLTGNVGRVSLCTKGSFLLNQRVGLLVLKGDINREYIYQALSCKRFEQSMIACSQGAVQMNIGKGDVENFTIPYSQNSYNISLVSSTLKSYDERILFEEKCLDLLNRQKRHLLAQMFI